MGTLMKLQATLVVAAVVSVGFACQAKAEPGPCNSTNNWQWYGPCNQQGSTPWNQPGWRMDPTPGTWGPNGYTPNYHS